VREKTAPADALSKNQKKFFVKLEKLCVFPLAYSGEVYYDKEKF